MSKGMGYPCGATTGQIVHIASNLPKNGDGLLKKGWEDISHPAQAASGHYTYRDPDTGLRIRYDKAKADAPGFAGKNHYHILNPNATGNHNLYLDKNGNPVRKNSGASHILPQEEDS